MKNSWHRFFDHNISLAFRHASHLFAAEVWVSILALTQGLLAARLLGAGQYGTLALITTCVTIANQFVDFRIRETAVTFTAGFLAQGQKEKAWASIKLCYLIDLASGVAAFLLVVLLAPFAAKVFIHQPHATWLIILYAATLLVSTTEGASLGVLAACSRFPLISIYFSAYEALKLCAVWIFLMQQRTVESVLYAYLIASIFGNALLIVFSIKTIRAAFTTIPRAKLGILSGHWRAIIRFLCNTNASEVLALFTKNIDVLILGYFRSSPEVGVYRLAKNFANTLGMVAGPVYTVIYPSLVSLWANRKLFELRGFIVRITMIMAGITVPLAILLFVSIAAILTLAVGTTYPGAKEAVRIMIWGPVISAIFVWIRPTFLAMQKPVILTIINCIGALTLVLFSLIFVPTIGVPASALLFVYPYLFGHVVALLAFRKLWTDTLRTAV